MIERFLRGLEISPDRDAVRVGSDLVTYRQAHETALLWAGSLMADGSHGSVGVLAGKSRAAYVGLLAVLYAGGTVVPLQPSFPAKLTRRMMKMAGVDKLIADDRGLAVLPEILDEEMTVRVLDTDGLADNFPTIPVTSDSALSAPVQVAADGPAYILFTSGSTGVPKGVPISHRGFATYFGELDRRCDFGSNDVFSQTFDLNFDLGIHDVFAAWGAGATLQEVPPSAYRDLPAYVAEHGITVWNSTPSGIWMTREMEGLEKGALNGLRWSFFGGEALRCQDVEDWLVAAPGSKLDNIYGPTEFSIGICWHRWLGEESKKRGVNGTVPIGKVHAGHDFRLVTEQGEQSSVEGELWVTGPQISTGYLDPAENEGRFVDLDGRRWYRTGDRVRATPDGDLSYIGRLDSQVKVHAWRIELAEVDHVVSECDGVRDAVTVPKPAEHGTELIVFYTGDEVPESTLANGVRAVLPYTVLPRRYVHLDEFPLNSNRKVDRLALRKRAEELRG
ncbi:amino acid adenylation domain-containing protein [Streptomyces griseochromogenes]|uniref:Amino acid adenylation domain-containing protein n=1 Tax=Streptomyces griseochromogenes TaxID=68214 RepID=A0ABS4MAQ2_9ACTN|nr:AMP-binding protein [Streptomyces griseochromogenes]MBP2056751.1 amino acid adenylation domain-containing protein [Streptomyces griseochromogenes]